MTLKELQQMIKEELNEFQGGRHDAYKKSGRQYGPSRAEMDKGITYEAEDEVDVSVSDSDVDVDAEMGGEPEGEVDVLRQIYDLLAAHFEGGDEEEIGGEEDVEDLEGGEDEVAEQTEDEYYYGREEGKVNEEEELDELSNHGMGKSAGKTSGKNAGYTPAKGVKEGKTPLQERFQKLANIIK